MDPLRLLIRASQLVRNPPSQRRLVIYGAALAASLIVAGIEWVWGWPDWLTVNGKVR